MDGRCTRVAYGWWARHMLRRPRAGRGRGRGRKLLAGSRFDRRNEPRRVSERAVGPAPGSRGGHARLRSSASRASVASSACAPVSTRTLAPFIVGGDGDNRGHHPRPASLGRSLADMPWKPLHSHAGVGHRLRPADARVRVVLAGVHARVPQRAAAFIAVLAGLALLRLLQAAFDAGFKGRFSFDALVCLLVTVTDLPLSNIGCIGGAAT